MPRNTTEASAWTMFCIGSDSEPGPAFTRRSSSALSRNHSQTVMSPAEPKNTASIHQARG